MKKEQPKKNMPKARIGGRQRCPRCGSKHYRTVRYDGFANVYQCRNCFGEFTKHINCF